MKSKLLFATLLFFLSLQTGDCCTNLLVSRGASSNNSCMLSYAADSPTRYGCLFHFPAADYPAGTMMDIFEWGPHRFLGRIPQAEHTYNVVGNMNEHQVVIGESTWGGLASQKDPDGILDYGSLIYICLQRSRTAREAIECFVSLANRYGYASSGESISFADPNEIWFMDVIGKAPRIENGQNINKGIVWVAVRIPDGYISAHANQARIRQFNWNDPNNCLYAPDVASHARETGLYSGSDENFSFADTYGPANSSTIRACDARVWSFFNKHGAEDMEPYLSYALGKDSSKPMPLYVKAKSPLSLKDVADMMRDHYEGTAMDMRNDIGAGTHETPYRFRPRGFEVDGVKYASERPISTQQTGFWFIGQCRNNIPYPAGGIFWFAVDDSGTSPLTPVYSCSTEVSSHYALGQNSSMLQYSGESMFWLCNRIAQFAYLRYNQIGAEVRENIDAHENKMIARIETVDKAALLLAEKDTESARRFLTKFSLSSAESLFSKWKNLDQYLLVKYIDGYTKHQNADGSFIHNPYCDSVPIVPANAGYSKNWKEMVVKDAGERLREF